MYSLGCIFKSSIILPLLSSIVPEIMMGHIVLGIFSMKAALPCEIWLCGNTRISCDSKCILFSTVTRSSCVNCYRESCANVNIGCDDICMFHLLPFRGLWYASTSVRGAADRGTHCPSMLMRSASSYTSPSVDVHYSSVQSLGLVWIGFYFYFELSCSCANIGWT